MKITIEGNTKEIADFVLVVQSRQEINANDIVAHIEQLLESYTKGIVKESSLSDLEQWMRFIELYALKERSKWLKEFNASRANENNCK